MDLKKCIWFIETKLTYFMYGHVGKNSYIGKTLFVKNRKKLYIGNKVRIYPGMRVEIVNKSSKITIKDNVSVGQNFHVVSYEDNLIIGSNVTISANVFISNVDHNYITMDKSVLDQDLIAKKTIIGDGCFIGYGACILPGTILGKNCVVGANAVVKGVFEECSVVGGVPAKLLKKL